MTATDFASAQDRASASFLEPVFDRPWLVGLVVVGGASLLAWIIVRLRLGSLRRRERELRIVVEQRTRELSSLANLTETINRAVRLDDVLEHVWRSFRMVTPYNRIGFAEVDAGEGVVRAVWARSDASEIRIGTGYSAPLNETSLGKILATGKPRIIGDLQRYLAHNPTSDATRAIVEEGMQASLTVPLRAMGNDIGFLFFSSQQRHAYTDEHIRLLEGISGQLSLAIEKSRLYDKLLDTTRRLEGANAQLERLAATDGLTGVANRRIFDERLAREWLRCRRNHAPLSIMMIDIDHFKRFNDLHGHLAGDGCLKAVAETLSNALARASDLVARYGGEEFGVILPETDCDRARDLAEEIRKHIGCLATTHELCTEPISVSIGVATEVPDADRTAEQLLHDADTNLFAAKRDGRNRVHASPCGSSSSHHFDPVI